MPILLEQLGDKFGDNSHRWITTLPDFDGEREIKNIGITIVQDDSQLAETGTNVTKMHLELVMKRWKIHSTEDDIEYFYGFDEFDLGLRPILPLYLPEKISDIGNDGDTYIHKETIVLDLPVEVQDREVKIIRIKELEFEIMGNQVEFQCVFELVREGGYELEQYDESADPDQSLYWEGTETMKKESKRGRTKKFVTSASEEQSEMPEKDTDTWLTDWMEGKDLPACETEDLKDIKFTLATEEKDSEIEIRRDETTQETLAEEGNDDERTAVAQSEEVAQEIESLPVMDPISELFEEFGEAQSEFVDQQPSEEFVEEGILKVSWEELMEEAQQDFAVQQARSPVEQEPMISQEPAPFNFFDFNAPIEEQSLEEMEATQPVAEFPGVDISTVNELSDDRDVVNEEESSVATLTDDVNEEEPTEMTLADGANEEELPEITLTGEGNEEETTAETLTQDIEGQIDGYQLEELEQLDLKELTSINPRDDINTADSDAVLASPEDTSGFTPLGFDGSPNETITSVYAEDNFYAKPKVNLGSNDSTKAEPSPVLTAPINISGLVATRPLRKHLEPSVQSKPKTRIQLRNPGVVKMYLVKQGDTWEKISSQFGIPADEIMKLNAVNNLPVLEMIQIPSAKA